MGSRGRVCGKLGGYRVPPAALRELMIPASSKQGFFAGFCWFVKGFASQREPGRRELSSSSSSFPDFVQEHLRRGNKEYKGM